MEPGLQGEVAQAQEEVSAEGAVAEVEWEVTFPGLARVGSVSVQIAGQKYPIKPARPATM
jgi:hypothetical protein